MVSEIKHGDLIYQRLTNELPKNEVIFLNSKAKNKSFNERIIIGTSVIDEGIDLPDREIIIMASGGKSSIKTIQRIGRILRPHKSKETALIIDFKDKTKYLFDHSLKREEIYNEYGFQ